MRIEAILQIGKDSVDMLLFCNSTDFDSEMGLWFGCITITVKIVQVVNDTMLTKFGLDVRVSVW